MSARLVEIDRSICGWRTEDVVLTSALAEQLRPTRGIGQDQMLTSS